ncbi:bifunctional rhamnulose-1-phosphate aldolase/short-chain dehydrogenase [Sphingobacterium spiritivorum]|uniref:Rhamnulose-1-phosphate aldolase/alcohol dehydrogenase n=1 Tax=Sphingobacterium spiritivorum ATCC 33861 TaxID=525373 RepID=D7VJN0_SPHSI|nr:bifunctional rhamnulose-1-phosphate aldolase/short-chain dehydrogenase [Sphingobacterium spiritivorum]EFK59083.1 rhamnulose-1-phosphate aldolase/alcohol dehydrogenase [Sphingobacterium spiritivorum ATCC 33861]QQT36940.1 bifunctional rhamnulose-1-phosphate aldolase/short-chain dehydrogenase [Sphingobacterium spiritivorum]WQD33702.1 bifunctional rhamnulose-1-phosphate aldolase/short-chain dehydrogenase [Sphingobacterium spiritivorum]SUJ25957.1 Diacetyl reductase [(S)-acetoin forming] [Sphingob
MKTYKHVNYLWDDEKAKSLEGDEVGLLLYRSNLLGSDLRITNYGGGNTSCKVVVNDPLTGSATEVMWIKGSGGDIGTLTKSGLAALYVERLRGLKSVYRGIEHEDEMVELFNHCIYDLASKAPSIDTPLHGFLPFKHIDHLHPDAAIAIAAAKDGERITQELFDGTIGWVDWQKPGFDLGLQLKECLDKNPSIRGIMLGSHGLFTWGDTAYESYVNTLDVIERCAAYLEDNFGKKGPVFGGQQIESLAAEERVRQAAKLAPVLRGFCSSKRHMIGHFTDDDRVLEFINSNDLKRLAPLGTSCPDHFLRTKISPLVLDLGKDEDLSDTEALKARLAPAFEAYRAMYTAYYESCKHPNSPAIRDENPVIILYPGVGMFSFSKDKQTARVAAEFYINAINVMKGAEAISSYTSLPRQEAFNIEYWLLEEAKLQRMPKPKALSGKIALVTGSAGGIGKAIAKKFVNEGAVVVLNDMNAERLEAVAEEFQSTYGKDAFATVVLDVTREDQIEQALSQCALAFGGVDIVVNNAGLSISKTIEDHTEKDWDLLYNVLVKGQFFVTREAVKTMKKQAIGGDIINIVSKNALVSGPNNAGYGSAKSAQLHLSRLNAAELGSAGIRVNVVNPDAVISDSNIWANGWAEGRAKAYGITVAELPAYYANRTLLKEIILPEDIANACFAFAGGLLNKSTGNVLNVDGGVAMAFVR